MHHLSEALQYRHQGLSIAHSQIPAIVYLTHGDCLYILPLVSKDLLFKMAIIPSPSRNLSMSTIAVWTQNENTLYRLCCCTCNERSRGFALLAGDRKS